VDEKDYARRFFITLECCGGSRDILTSMNSRRGYQRVYAYIVGLKTWQLIAIAIPICAAFIVYELKYDYVPPGQRLQASTNRFVSCKTGEGPLLATNLGESTRR